jgi:PAS domain S-box-containing protein
MPDKRLYGTVKRISTSAKANFQSRRGETDAFIRAIFPGESEMAGRMRDFDWSMTDLGPPRRWPENLRVTARLCLTSRFPIVVWWGPNYTMFYNDAYISFLGRTKHPQWLGRSGMQCWQEIWPVIGPMLEGVFGAGQATWSQDLQMILDRNLPQEEGYFTFSYSPILDDKNRVNGIWGACFETTEQVVGTRRLETLRRLGVRTPETRTVEAACEKAANVLAENPYDIPFSAIYLVDGAGTRAELKSLAGFPEDAQPFPSSISVSDGDIFPWPLASSLQARSAAEISDLTGAGLRLPGGPWPEPASKAVVLPIFAAEGENLSGLTVLGVSPRRVLDDAYRTFFGLIADHIGAAVSDAKAYEAEQKRAEALAEELESKGDSQLVTARLIREIEEAARGVNVELSRRLAELEKANVEIRDSRRAALNLMEDAIRAKEALRESEERFRHMADNAPVMIWVSEPDGACTYLSRSWYEFTRQTPETGLGFGWLDATHPDDRQYVSEAFIAANERGEAFRVEYRLRRQDGEYRWVIDSAAPRISPNGEFLGYIGSVIDITDRKRAETALEESEERFRMLSDNAPTLIWVDGPTGCEFVNQAYLDYLGLDEAPGYDWAQFVHPEDREGYVNAYLEAASRRGRFKAECRIRRRDGEYRWVQATGRPRFEGGEFKGYIGASVDIHERKLAETLSAQLAAIVESSSDAIIGTDLNGIITNWNKGAEKLFGYVADEVIGKPGTILFPDERLDEERGILERLRRGERIEHYDTVRRRKDGREIDISLAVSPIRDKAGKVIGASKIARDISERKRAEAEMEELLLKESAARSEAEAANHSKDEFIALVSHELRAPLNSILGYNRMLGEKGLDEGRLKRCCDVIERNARAQLRLIEDLLDTARIANGKLLLDVRRLDINPVIAAALDTVRPAADTKGVRLRIANCELRIADSQSSNDQVKMATPGGDPSAIRNPQSAIGESVIVLGDAARLQQIFCNLLSNAIKFTPAGGSIELRVERAGEHIRIVVSDTGKGIQPEFLPYVFDRFRQRDSSSSQRSGGLGLGLALVKRLTELHGGKVEAASEGAGRGATFTVTLPLADQSELRVSEPPPLVVSTVGANGETWTEGGIIIPAGHTIAGVRVLVVDDHEDARALLAYFLGRCGAVVSTASSGAEALTVLSNSWGGARPDVMLCDIAMPDEDGYEALRQVRALEEALGVAASERIPVVALTALTGNEERLRSLRAGFHFHVTKPVDPVELTLVIANVTGTMRQEANLQ